MRYCRIDTIAGPSVAAIETRDGEDWITQLLRGFPEAPGEGGPRSDPFFEPILFAGAPLLPPVVPSKIVCVGRNYRDHAAELGNEVPKEPLLFFKPPSSLLRPGGAIVYPALSSRVDYEGELAIVIGKKARNLRTEDEIRSSIRGYTLLNDVTARDLQKSDAQWTRGKGFDTFCPVGPLVTDEVDPLREAVVLKTFQNGIEKQSGSTADFIFPIVELLRSITAFLTLEPGDVIATGTPAGVGPVHPGDTVEVCMEGIGTLAGIVISEKG